MPWLDVVGARDDAGSGTTWFEIAVVGPCPETHCEAPATVHRRFSEFYQLRQKLVTAEKAALGSRGARPLRPTWSAGAYGSRLC